MQSFLGRTPARIAFVVVRVRPMCEGWPLSLGVLVGVVMRRRLRLMAEGRERVGMRVLVGVLLLLGCR